MCYPLLYFVRVSSLHIQSEFLYPTCPTIPYSIHSLYPQNLNFPKTPPLTLPLHRISKPKKPSQPPPPPPPTPPPSQDLEPQKTLPTTPSPPPSTQPSSTTNPPPEYAHSGRGGAGNWIQPSTLLKTGTFTSSTTPTAAPSSTTTPQISTP